MGIKRLIDQWNTKTAGGSSKLSVSDYHLIQDPIHIQDTNIDALELSNTVGQATNTQSQSGPMPGTHENVEVTDTTGSGNPNGVLFQPEAGTVYQLVGASTDTLNATRCELSLWDGSIYVEVGSETSAATQFSPGLENPIYITNEVYLQYYFIGASGNCTVNCSVIRVR